MALVKINVYETVERTTEVTFEIPDDMELTTDPQDALDALWVHPDATAIGSDVIEESITTSAADDFRREI